MKFHTQILQVFCLLILLILINCNPSAKKVELNADHKIPMLAQSSFVGSESCKECHEKEYQSWMGSHHQLAMQEANQQTVLANFNTEVEFNGVKSTFFADSGNYYVKTAGKTGEIQDFKIIYTFGVTPLQQYIAEFPDGSYQCLQTAWDSEKDQWFDLQPNLEIEPGEWLHWTGNAMKWNTACADCHSTNVHKNFNPSNDSYNTTYSEITVGCESCHGPACAHVRHYEKELKGTPPEMYMSGLEQQKELVQKCARCHSRRTQITSFFNYDGHFLDHYEPQLITSPTYETDGQILDEDYVYGSFMQSKMYHEGVSCKDCHDMHSTKRKMEGNQLCMQCHKPQYDSKQHHFHEMDTEASQCINCHMTGRYYMGNDFRRDHSFRVPRPDQSDQFSTPNACNGCHDDQSTHWASEKVKEWYGDKRADHFSDHLLKGFAGDKNELFYLLDNQKYPDIARASALSYLTSMVAPDDLDKIAKYLKDTSALVRNEAVKVIGLNQSPEIGAPLLRKLLDDPVRMVRITAAEKLNLWGQAEPENPDFTKANEENREMLDMIADFPGGQQRIAELSQAKGDIPKAIAAYEKALEIDNYNNTIRMNLALLLYQTGDASSAENLYLKVINQEPQVSYPYYMLGLLYNEQSQPQKAQGFMKQACNKEPYIDRAFYNYSIMLQQANQHQKSISIIQKGLNRGGQNQPDLQYMKLLAEMKLKQWKDAKATAELLVELTNGDPRFVQILEEFEGRLQ